MADDAQTPQFVLDASRMKRGMMTSPLAYNKMYSASSPGSANAMTKYSSGADVRAKTDAAEEAAVRGGADAGEIGKKWSDTFQK